MSTIYPLSGNGATVDAVIKKMKIMDFWYAKNVILLKNFLPLTYVFIIMDFNVKNI